MHIYVYIHKYICIHFYMYIRLERYFCSVASCPAANLQKGEWKVSAKELVCACESEKVFN